MADRDATLPLRIAVLGAGGVGGYFGGVLAQAGCDVTLLARGEHLAAIRSRGLELRLPATVSGTGHADPAPTTLLVPINATDDAQSIGAVDFVLIAVKSYSLHEIAPTAERLAVLGAAIVPLLNGVEAADRLAEHGVPRSALLGGVTMISAERIAPGVVERRSNFERVIVGPLANCTVSSSHVTRIVHAFTQAGVDARLSARIDVELWQKLVFLASMAAVCGLARRDVGSVRRAPLGRLLIERAVAEVASVGRAHGVALDDDIAARTIAAIDALPDHMRPSFLLDLECGGPTELEVLSGAVSRYGRQYGIPTPVHDTAVAALGTPGHH